MAKTVAPTSDPVNGVTNPKSIPGSVQLYNVRVTNQGSGPVDNNAVVDRGSGAGQHAIVRWQPRRAGFRAR